MEDETRAFLIRILNTLSIVLLWMMLNVFFGLYFEFAIIDKAPNMKNILFYISSVLSFAWLIYHLKKKWEL